MPIDQIISFNVGGEYFQTGRETIYRFPNSKIYAIINGDYPNWPKDSKKTVFFDRDPLLFRHVLNFMRTGYIYLCTESSFIDDLDVLLDGEAQYFELPELSKWLGDNAEVIKRTKNNVPTIQTLSNLLTRQAESSHSMGGGNLEFLLIFVILLLSVPIVILFLCSVTPSLCFLKT
ncbi:hypothetical protein SNEBB_000105 [Seison nebaliae]|nr:hypothetical protein SNEBB_000105 [Seison nebaliae]